MKGEIDNSITIGGDFNSPTFNQVGRRQRKK